MTDSHTEIVIGRLELTEFRNYGTLGLDFAGGLNVLWGANGAGKTNLLEAIAFLALGRSPRTPKDAELVHSGGVGFTLRASVGEHAARGDVQHIIGAAYHRTQGKRVEVDGRPLPRVIDICGHLLAVYFSPDDLWMVKAGPAGRRQLLDRLLAQESPLYADALVRYRQALAQRNQTLRDMRARRAGRAMLAIWEPQLIQYGGEILSRRAQAIRRLAPLVASSYARLAPEGEELAAEHQPGLPEGERVSADASTAAWGKALEHALAAHREADVVAGVTGVGPQRDDLRLRLGGRSLRQHGSQGQQRSAVLALKFAERRYLTEQTGRVPIMLVDDVLSELDQERRKGLRESLGREGQVFLTTADQEQAKTLAATAYWHVRAGQVTPDPPR